MRPTFEKAVVAWVKHCFDFIKGHFFRKVYAWKITSENVVGLRERDERLTFAVMRFIIIS